MSEDGTDTSAVLVVTPAHDDPVNELSAEDQCHVSLLFFGEAAVLPPDLVIDLRAVIAGAAGQFDPFVADVSGVAVLGDGGAAVLLVESFDLVALRNALAAEDCVQQAYALAERQFPSWIPHLTLRYDGTLPTDPPKSVAIDALGLWLGGTKTGYPLSADGMGDIEDELMAAGLTIPPVRGMADLSIGLQFADEHPSARWYVAKRATALGCASRIPEQWTGVA